MSSSRARPATGAGWSGSAARRRGAGTVAALALLLPLALAGCSGFRPVYGEGGSARAGLEFAYAKPGNRLEQIIVQDLMLKLGSSRRPDVPEVKIAASAGSRVLTHTSVDKPATHYEAAVTASYTVTREGEVLLSGTRRASASYFTVGQVLADESAAKDARERAAREVAETIRLSILAELSAPLREASFGQ